LDKKESDSVARPPKKKTKLLTGTSNFSYLRYVLELPRDLLRDFGESERIYIGKMMHCIKDMEIAFNFRPSVTMNYLVKFTELTIRGKERSSIMKHLVERKEFQDASDWKLLLRSLGCSNSDDIPDLAVNFVLGKVKKRDLRLPDHRLLIGQPEKVKACTKFLEKKVDVVRWYIPCLDKFVEKMMSFWKRYPDWTLPQPIVKGIQKEGLLDYGGDRGIIKFLEVLVTRIERGDFEGQPTTTYRWICAIKFLAQIMLSIFGNPVFVAYIRDGTKANLFRHRIIESYNISPRPTVKGFVHKLNLDSELRLKRDKEGNPSHYVVKMPMLIKIFNRWSFKRYFTLVGVVTTTDIFHEFQESLRTKPVKISRTGTPLYIYMNLEPRSGPRRALMSKMYFLKKTKEGNRSYLFVEKGQQPALPEYELEYDS